MHAALLIVGCAISLRVCAFDLTLHVGTNLIANQLNLINRPGGNTISNLFDRRLPDWSYLYVYKMGSCGQPVIYVYCQDCGIVPGHDWFLEDSVTPTDANATLDPGDALAIFVEQSVIVHFTGDPNMPVLPVALPCGCGYFYMLSRQTNDIGTFQNITGLSPQEGSQFQRWNGSNYNVFTFSSGAWTPSVPAASVGEAVRILPSPCFSNGCLSMAPPANVLVSSCTNVQVYYNPTVSNRCNNPVSVVCTPGSGSFFAPGTTTTVHCLATDSAGNGAGADFNVTVVGPRLEVSQAGNLLMFTWNGAASLQEAVSVAGPWEDIQGSDLPPFFVNSTAPVRFYRLLCR